MPPEKASSGRRKQEKNPNTPGESDLASENQADLNRDAERVEADKARLQSRSDSDVSRDLGRADVGRSGAKRQAEGDERLRVERQTSDEAIKGERLRTDAATEKGRSDHQSSARSSAELLSQEQKSHQKTRATLTTREEFLAIVSHDLRNPLNNISMAAQNLLEDPKDIKELAASINRSAGEMLRLIEDLLDIERIAAGKLALHIEQHDVNEIIKQSVEQLQGAAVSKGITLEAEPHD